MNFGDAITQIRDGSAVALSSWNGETEKTTFIYLSGGTQINDTSSVSVLSTLSISSAYISSRIDKRLNTGEIIYGWVPSQDEMLSDQWELLTGTSSS